MFEFIFIRHSTHKQAYLMCCVILLFLFNVYQYCVSCALNLKPVSHGKVEWKAGGRDWS